ncbi:unnamed protein product [Amoebophrya sp. A25]|nr:unnamed protein product [Amoebophrya sp. A25]|eukprot:GSA25T00024565001.1
MSSVIDATRDALTTGAKEVGKGVGKAASSAADAVRSTNWTAVAHKAQAGVDASAVAVGRGIHASASAVARGAKEVGNSVSDISNKLNATSSAELEAYGKEMRHPSANSTWMNWSCADKVLAAAGLGAAGGVALVPLSLEILGFGAEGVESGSVAAKWQSSIGNVAAGSLFAVLTSIAMGGISNAPFVLVPGFVAGSTAAVGVLEEVCKPDEYGIIGKNGDRSEASDALK